MKDTCELVESIFGGLSRYRPSLRYLLLDEGALPADVGDAVRRSDGEALLRMARRILTATTVEEVLGDRR